MLRRLEEQFPAQKDENEGPLQHALWGALLNGVAAIGLLAAIAGVFTPLMELTSYDVPLPLTVDYPSYFTAFDVRGEYNWRDEWPVTGGERVVITALACVPWFVVTMVWRRRPLAALPLLLSAAALFAVFLDVNVPAQSDNQDSGVNLELYGWSVALVPVGAFLTGAACLTRLWAARAGRPFSPTATYDPHTDTLYVRLVGNASVARQTFLDDHRIVDRSEDGAVIGVEFVAASDGVELADVPFAQQIEELIGGSGHSFRILV